MVHFLILVSKWGYIYTVGLKNVETIQQSLLVFSIKALLQSTFIRILSSRMSLLHHIFVLWNQSVSHTRKLSAIDYALCNKDGLTLWFSTRLHKLNLCKDGNSLRPSLPLTHTHPHTHWKWIPIYVLPTLRLTRKQLPGLYDLPTVGSIDTSTVRLYLSQSQLAYWLTTITFVET